MTIGKTFKMALVLGALGLVPAASQAAESSWKAAAAPAKSACECARSKRCWPAVLTAYKENSLKARGEVDGAGPDRFFPDSEVILLETLDEEGNFLLVRCGPEREACADERDELQRRLIFASFLASLPAGRKEGPLFDPRTWALTDEGEKVIAALRRCKPGLAVRLVAIATK